MLVVRIALRGPRSQVHGILAGCRLVGVIRIPEPAAWTRLRGKRAARGHGDERARERKYDQWAAAHAHGVDLLWVAATEQQSTGHAPSCPGQPL
jgi:hypothetical protein